MEDNLRFPIMPLLPRRSFKPGVLSPRPPKKRVEENWGVRLRLQFGNNILTFFACFNVKCLINMFNIRPARTQVFELKYCRRVLSLFSSKTIKEFKSQYVYIVNTIPHGKCMYLRTHFCIRDLTRSLCSLCSLVRFQICHQLVRKYQTFTFSRKYSLFICHYCFYTLSSFFLYHLNTRITPGEIL